MTLNGIDRLSFGAIGASALVSAALYSRLPDKIPVHFDIHGTADGFLPRMYGAFLLPVIAVGVCLFLRSGVLLPAAWRGRMDAPASRIVVALTALLFSLLHGVVLYSALHPGESVGGMLGFILGIFWIALGLILPRVRRNPWIGIRTRWTLASDENWARTHRFASYTFVPSGIFAVAAVLIGFPSFAVGAIIVSALVSTIYSYVQARS